MRESSDYAFLMMFFFIYLYLDYFPYGYNRVMLIYSRDSYFRLTAAWLLGTFSCSLKLGIKNHCPNSYLNFSIF